MKREERKLFNEMRKLDVSGLINVGIPSSFSHEARQAIHEQLTTVKGLIATKVCWNDIRNEYCILYVPASSKEERQQQECEDIDSVMARIPRSDYTWNGYKKPEEKKPEEEKPEEKKPEEKKPEFIEKVRAAFKDAKERLDAGEEMHVHFSEGNNKTHMPSLDLLPLLTCHGRCREMCGKVPEGKYLPPCYAAKIVNCRPACMKNYAENTVLAIFRPGQYWQEVEEKMKTCRFMRLFVSGDAIINGYFEHLCVTLENNPHVEMQGFSKCWEIVNRYIDAHGALPKNLHLLLSGWGDRHPDNPHNLPESMVFEKTLPEGWLSCGGNCAHCACIGLGCWKATAGDVVGLKKH